MADQIYILHFFLFVAEVILAGDTDCYRYPATSYSGTWNVTQSGVACQRWDAQAPHEHRYVYMNYFPMEETLYDVHNYCRDTEDTGDFWCYTIDSNIRWDECNIPKCNDDTTPTTDYNYVFDMELYSNISQTIFYWELATLNNLSTTDTLSNNIDGTNLSSYDTTVTQGANKIYLSVSLTLIQTIYSLFHYF